jgi:Protein of unknown function (DUF2938)
MLLRDLGAGALSGIGATVLIDLWALLLRAIFHIPSLDPCLLGRWVLHMPSGTFAHPSIAKAAPKPGECPAGWVTHYLIGATLGAGFALLAGRTWWANPTLWQPLTFGIVTLVMPFFLMQPALGLGIASSKAPNPAAVRLKSLGTHTVFGVGLYLSARVLGMVLPGFLGS